MPPTIVSGRVFNPRQRTNDGDHYYSERSITVSKTLAGTFHKPHIAGRQGAYDPVGGIFDKPRLPEAEASFAVVAPLKSRRDPYGDGDLKAQILKLAEPGPITVKLDDQDVVIFVDPDRGPRWGKKPDDFVRIAKFSNPMVLAKDKPWDALTMDEKQNFLVALAKKFRYWNFTGVGVKSGDGEEEDDGPERTKEEIEAIVKEGIQQRCQMECMKRTVWWTTITIDQVTANHRRRSPGMFYGMEFPWTEAMLIEFGPDWLTKAFQAAGSLGLDNRITKIFPEKKLKITTGNNGGKFLFDVKYAKKRPGLHTRLFAKVPFPLEGSTRSDRLSSSVNKQPQEFYEINASRLLEGSMPAKMPKYYFGDISNDTSNFILITEAIPFADPEPLNFGAPTKRRRRLPPDDIEGPYDKCMDHTLRGKPLNYYTLLVKTGAMIAGYHKSGRLAPEELLRANFGDMADKDAQFFGLVVGNVSGDDPRTVKPKLDIAQTFFHDTGRALFPDYVTEEWCSGKLRDLMMGINAYSGEIQFWKHSNQDYIALTHINLNVDNAYFWRDAEGTLQLGIFDWGNLGSMCLGHKLWWWVYCADYENVRDNLDHYVETFITTYEENGGPKLDAATLRMQVIITSLEQMFQLMFAVPQIFKMCPKGEWPSIEHRYDPRISENIDGKSSLRLYLHVMNSIMRIIEELDGAATFQRFVDEIWVGAFKAPPKPSDVVHGLVKVGIGL